MEEFFKLHKCLDLDTIILIQVGTCEAMIFSPMLVFACFLDYTNCEELLNYALLDNPESSIKVKLYILKI